MIKKLILLGFGLVLLIGLPLTIFVLQNQSQTTTQSGAAPVTKFSFSGPTTANTGDNFDENIVVDPGGVNQVSFVKFTFTFNPTYITQQSTPFTVPSQFTQLEAPTITCTSTLCTATGTISIGSDQTALIKSPTTIATVHLTATTNTDTNGTQLSFVTGQNEALSVGPSDQAAENVFQAGVDATIVIGAQTTGTPTPTETTTTTTTGTGSGGSSGSGTGGTSGTNGVTVSCTGFTANQTSGQAPLIVTFTSVGTSPNDSISQLVVTYGDGTSDTVASGSGIGTGDVNNQISHTYSSNGTFTANAVFTTEGGATSNSSACTQTITVGQQLAQASASAAPTLPSTGPGQTIVMIGAAGALISLIGLATIFIL